MRSVSAYPTRVTNPQAAAQQPRLWVVKTCRLELLEQAPGGPVDIAQCHFGIDV